MGQYTSRRESREGHSGFWQGSRARRVVRAGKEAAVAGQKGENPGDPNRAMRTWVHNGTA